MTQAQFPNLTPRISITLGQAAPLLLGSIALEELALAHVINAEAEKIQFVLGTLTPSRPLTPPTVTISNLLAINQDVRRTLQDVIKKEMLQQFKFENILELLQTSPGGAAVTASNAHIVNSFLTAPNVGANNPIPLDTNAKIDSTGAIVHVAGSTDIFLAPNQEFLVEFDAVGNPAENNVQLVVGLRLNGSNIVESQADEPDTPNGNAFHQVSGGSIIVTPAVGNGPGGFSTLQVVNRSTSAVVFGGTVQGSPNVTVRIVKLV